MGGRRFGRRRARPRAGDRPHRRDSGAASLVQGERWEGTVRVESQAHRAFHEHRGRLQAVAYRVLGRAGDAEDVVQEAWLRWSRVDAEQGGAEQVAQTFAIFARKTARLAEQEQPSVRLAEINGGPAIVASVAGTPTSVLVLHLVDGAVETIHLMANPEKMTGLMTGLTRADDGLTTG
ncbi:hypothetical protein J7E98_30680 [Streptomyces sp. ISL-86]|nr:hypothetical protein [Streptomyces sp. ISL-86]